MSGSEVCGWQGPRDVECARPAAWGIYGDPDYDQTTTGVYSCNVHLGDVVRERAIEWVGCWVDKA